MAALITGASSGIGLELARLFARDGRGLVLVARRREKLQELARELTGRHGVSVRVIAKDLAAASAPAEIAAELASDQIPVETLVNNAGFGIQGPFLGTDLGQELEMIRVNVTALTELTRRFLPQMKQRGAGRILNVASTAAFQPGPLMAVYYATKAYVLSFSEALSCELAGTGITVTALCPGATQTEFHARPGMGRTKLFQRRVMSAEAAARAGYLGALAGRRVVIPGLKNRLMAWAVPISPRGLVLRGVRWINSAPEKV